MIDLRLGDCLDVMPTLEAQSFDAIIADIPYGTTACKWDTVIPFAPMWAELKRLAKPRAAIVLFGSQPFTSALVMSNPQWFRYEWIWDKVNISGFLNSKNAPLKQHENVLVFSSNGHIYNPQMFPTPKWSRARNAINRSKCKSTARVYGFNNYTDCKGTRESYPRTLINVGGSRQADKEHPTQKPVALMEYLIRTYTNEGDTVLDFTCGSGTTLVACVNTRRNGTGIEKDAGYFAIAQRRIAEAQAQLAMPMVTV